MQTQTDIQPHQRMLTTWWGIYFRVSISATLSRHPCCPVALHPASQSSCHPESTIHILHFHSGARCWCCAHVCVVLWQLFAVWWFPWAPFALYGFSQAAATQFLPSTIILAHPMNTQATKRPWDARDDLRWWIPYTADTRGAAGRWKLVLVGWAAVWLPRLINHNLCGTKGDAKKTLPSFWGAAN